MSGDVTLLLQAWRSGDAGARDRLAALVLPELRLLAGRQFRGERAGHTLQPTALVNEAWLRLSGLERIDWQDRAHFVHVAARLMRGILVDHARRRDAAKRDGGQRITLTGLDVPAPEDGLDVMALDAALARLEQLDPDKARVVELRYFGGLGIDETAEALGCSPATVKRHWQAARAWLYDALSPG
ncbi:sigma-70 family RNA polymerase sigma factor [Arenimonas terrae]|jgi:RNA polymerase sigma factor (TIGR02999 family)|uniref:Sigma-70 family RNA polymerase sigma factor n=1 Tax=Arenimonas terrae TaxID=2546226 RepID=A0A5C4RNM5_9GAMM|nr:sigma-70 family RNA polymerase sigma factor [Arenimonas terrae]TNJ32853.1 sigma-70 family RNA polymerase sigma factor [Arenimonas terrae]